LITLRAIGHSLKAHGKDGFLKLSVHDQYIEDLLKARALFIDMDGSDVPFLIKEIKESNHIFVKLDEIEDPQQASQLSSKEIYLHTDEITNLSDEVADQESELLNFKVLDQNEVYKGLIINVIENPHQILVEVKNDDKSFMMPLHENLIIQLNPDQQTIQVDIPEGLDEI